MRIFRVVAEIDITVHTGFDYTIDRVFSIVVILLYRFTYKVAFCLHNPFECVGVPRIADKRFFVTQISINSKQIRYRTLSSIFKYNNIRRSQCCVNFIST